MDTTNFIGWWLRVDSPNVRDKKNSGRTCPGRPVPDCPLSVSVFHDNTRVGYLQAQTQIRKYFTSPKFKFGPIKSYGFGSGRAWLFCKPGPKPTQIYYGSENLSPNPGNPILNQNKKKIFQKYFIFT